MNKPKIDLKARLGKRPGGTPASASIPPPVGVNQGPGPAANPMAGGMPSQGGYATPGGYPSAQSARPAFDAMGVGSVQAPAPIRAPSVPTAVDTEEEFRA